MILRVWSLPITLALGLNAGWVIEEATSYGVGEKSFNRITIDSQHYKSQNRGEALIIDLEKETVYFVRDSDKSYFGGRVDDVVAQLRKSAMSEMNEEENLFEEESGGVEEDKAIEIKKLAGRIESSGFIGERYQIFVNGEFKKEMFIAPKLTANNEIDLKKLNEIMLWLSGSFTPGAKKYIELDDKYISLIKQGYPIRTAEHDPSGGLILTIVVKAEQKSVARDEFALPKDYARVSSEDFYRPLE
ncbi:MAG: DUF4412 domain-containing protein [Helicobacteraceae bacterium]|jgi:hypothetical protein|nr:DUF4412 domain-containing protein [Helicobacteraceae bacterium]